MKRNKSKPSDTNGELRATRVKTKSTNTKLTSTWTCDKPLNTSDDISCQTSYPNSESHYLSLITSSPHEVAQSQPFEPVSVNIDLAKVWLSPDLIFYYLKVYIVYSEERKKCN